MSGLGPLGLVPPELLLLFPVLGPVSVGWPLLVLREKDRTDETHATRWVLAVLWMMPFVASPLLGFLTLLLFPAIGRGGGFGGMALGFFLIFYGLFFVCPAYVATAVLFLRPPLSFGEGMRFRLNLVGVAVLVLIAALFVGAVFLW